MKKLFIFLVVIFCFISIVYSGYIGDSLGDHKMKRDLNANEFSVVNPDLVDGVDVSAVPVSTTTLQQEIDNLQHGLLDYYLTNRLSDSDQYYLMVSSPQTGTETTFVKAITGTVVIASFTFNTALSLTTLKEGTYHFLFKASVTSVAKEIRLSFDFYSSTGTGETFLFSSAQSNLLTTDKAGYDVRIGTNDITGTIEYFSIRVIANLSGSGATPTLTLYTEGTNGTKLELPVRLEEIATVKIIPGINQNITPLNGKGDVTVNVTTRAFVAESIQFDQSPSAQSHNEGLLFYDSTEKTLTHYNDEAEIALQIGQEQWVRVRNNSGSDITDGKVVYLSGATGQIPTIELAQSDSMATSSIIGVATHLIENNSFGYVTTFGMVRDIDTSDFSDGDVVYVSSWTAGGLVNVKPVDPNYVVKVGQIAYANPSNGKLFVNTSIPLDSGDVAGLAALFESTGTVNRPMTYVVGFTDNCDYICDGASDYVQVQEAIDQAATDKKAGIIMCREGVYDFDSAAAYALLTKISSTTIVGQGNGTIFKVNGDGGLLDINHDFCKMINVRAWATTGAGTGSFISVDAPDFTLQDCSIDIDVDISDYAIVSSFANFKMTNCRLESSDSTYGVLSLASAADDCIISNNIFNSTMEGIIGGNGSDDVMIKDNQFIAASKAIDIDNAGSVRWQIEGNNFQGCTADIEDSGTGTNARNNIGIAGTYLADDVTLSTGAVVTNATDIATNVSDIATNVSDIDDIEISSGILTAAEDTPTKGDILYYDGTAWTQLGIGTDNHVLTVATDLPNWEASLSGNKNRMLSHKANSFETPSISNNASIVTRQFEVNSDTETLDYVKLTDTGNNYGISEGIMDREWDDAAHKVYVIMVASASSLIGNVIVNVEISTDSIHYTVIGTTVNVPATAWENGVVISTGWVTGTGFADGIPYAIKNRRVVADGCPQDIYIKNTYFSIVVD